MKSDNTGFIVNWYELGLELLNQSTSVRTLKEIKANCQNVNECCLKMFEEWLSQMPTANWDQLITALSNIGMGTAAKHIKDSLKQGLTFILYIACSFKYISYKADYIATIDCACSNLNEPDSD